LVPDDGIDPSVVFNPSFQFYSEAQEAGIFGSMDQAFIELRCFDCPLELGGVEIYKSDDAHLAGRTLAPQSQYLDQRIVKHLVGVTPGTQVTVSFDVSFNEAIGSPIGNASLMLVTHGYELAAGDDYRIITSEAERSAFGESGRATVEASFSNTGAVLAPLHFAQVMEVSGEATPLPEADNALLMAVGLGFLGWRCRWMLGGTRAMRG
jgi:hypothetical protein